MVRRMEVNRFRCTSIQARIANDQSAICSNGLWRRPTWKRGEKHGGTGQGATKAAVRAVRNAIEFNSIPGIVEAVPGGRDEMLISLKLGVPVKRGSNDDVMDVKLEEVAKVFPYGRLLPIEVVVGGLSFHTGRIVRELGDVDDMAVCVASCVSIGYDSGKRSEGGSGTLHKLYDTNDGV